MNIQPQGNYYDKYSSNNAIVKQLMRNFFKDMDCLLNQVKFQSVLEAGCGEGEITNYIKSNYEIYIEGFDIGHLAIEKAINNYKDIFFRTQSIYETDYKENQFDLVICSEVLEHLEYPQKALDNILKITSKYAVLSVPNEPIWRVLNMCRGKYLKDFGNTPGHINHWSKSSFLELVNDYGRIIDIKSPLPWTMVLIEK